MENNMVEKAKLIEKQKQNRLNALTGDLNIEHVEVSLENEDSNLSLKDLYMRLSLLCLSLLNLLKSSLYLSFANIFISKGLCYRSRIRLNAIMKEQYDFMQLKESIDKISHTIGLIEMFESEQNAKKDKNTMQMELDIYG